MTHFQLVLSRPEGNQSELGLINVDDEPMIDGQLLVDGEVLAFRGAKWLLKREQNGHELLRFTCTPVSAATEAASLLSPACSKVDQLAAKL